ncbi:MAG: DNA polymerase III subunit gamma/tau [Clostridia bacterium]|nr:DNA polymerase III subunit gamma/tau [Clostridia bacterium]
MSEYMALYRKYRPAVFSDVVGQDHITRVLRSEVMQDSVSHAYLFCGSRGTGKTTCAKILAKAANCLQPIDGDPCGVCERCRAFETTFDIVEMDAASHNGVDNIRELQDKISFLPIEMKRRVYIIDEVHMLSPGAFNALLKTLEEPPSHVMFILATTESHKIPATILSRCKRFDFHRINTDDITKRLEYVSEKEGIEIERDALKLISLLATGAMRDALSMLELFVGGKGITREIAEKSLGVVGNEIVLKLLRFIADRNAAGALETIADSYNSSKDPAVLCSELGNMLRNLLIMKCASGSVSSLIDECADVIETLRNVEDKFTPERLLYCTEIVEDTVSRLARTGLSRRTVLEMMAMRLCDSRLSTSTEALLERISSLEARPVSVSVSSAAPEQAKKEQTSAKEENVPPVPDDAPPFDFDDVPMPTDPPPIAGEPELPKPLGSDETKAKPADENIPEMIAYGDVLEEIKAKNMILYSMLTDSRGYLDGDVMTVKVSSMAIFMIGADPIMKQTVTECASKILGYAVTVNIVEDGGDSKGKKNDDFPMF